jgi:hypothetical protein
VPLLLVSLSTQKCELSKEKSNKKENLIIVVVFINLSEYKSKGLL